MPTTLAIRDETLSGEPSREWVLDVPTETMTVRELIRSRVYQEVQDYNLNTNVQRGAVFQGLVQPDDAEKVLNGWRLRSPACSTGSGNSIGRAKHSTTTIFSFSSMTSRLLRSTTNSRLGPTRGYRFSA